jgi:catechol 2,3-dioxygenase-like lactoylglutathione lyase family enzyme
VQLNQVTLPVRDLPAACAFYRRMGFLQIVDSPAYARFACADDGPSFSLELDPGSTPSGAVIYFETENLDHQVAELALRGIHPEEPPADRPWRWREAVYHDPSGNRLKLYHAGEDRLYPPWRVELSEPDQNSK